MIHSITIFTYGIYLDRKAVTPFINTIDLLRDENLTTSNIIAWMVTQNIE